MTAFVLTIVLRTTALAAASGVLLFAFRIRGAAARHAAWTAVLAAMLIAPLWTAWGPKLSLIRFARPAQPSTTVSAPLAPNAAAEAAWTAHQRTPAEILPAAARAPAPHRPWLPLALAVLYLAGAVVLLLRLLVGSVRAVRLARLGEGAAVAAPVTIGWFRPSILLPAAAHAWPQEQLACVLAHERAHARRRDPLVQWLALLNRALLWFHPLAWWLERKLASLAEEACDAAVVSAGHDPQSYSELLLRMARGIAHGGGRLVAAMPMPGGFLSRRVRSILDPAPPRVSRLRLAAFALIAAPAVVLALAAVQSVPPAQPDAIIDAAALPHFDVAALKPTDPNVRYRGLRQISAGGRIVYSAYTLHDLLHDAFGVERYQIAGGPDWTDTQNWDIEAKPPEGSPAASFIPRNPKVTPPPDELLMLRALLIERFHLRLALEKRPGRVYSLSPAKKGIKRDQFKPPAHADERPLVTQDRLEDPSQPGVNYAYEGHNATVAQLTQNLSQMLHMPVNDDSGLIGNFDYIVHYSQDSTAANAQYPGIFQALQDQLGLRLEAGKGPVATYVILHAERPHSQQDAQSSAPNPAAQRFEAASVKPSTTTSVMYVRPQPDRLTADATLKLLIQNAYSVQGYQVAGGPDWINSARYQVVATSNGNPGRGAIMAMLQAMLAERFGLAVYRETRDMPVFALQAAKGGPKLPAPRAGVCDDASHPPGPGDWAGGRMAAPGASPAAAAPCGSAAISLGGSAGAELKGGRIGMPELARLLALITGRSVIDRTGYAGAFDLQLDFLPGAVTAAMPPPPPGAGLSGPSLRDALREQLGLELAPARGPVEVIVIDRAQRPSAN